MVNRKVEEVERRLVAALDENGHEVPDPRPMSIPSGFKRPESLAEQVQRLVARGISDYAAARGGESWEEANDFEVDDDFDPSTPYEEFFDPVLGKSVTPDEFRQHADRYKEELLVRTRNFYRQQELEEFINQRGAGVSPAPSSDAAKPPPAEPQAPKSSK